MIKFRIKQIGDKFYPQQKRFLFWHYINVRTCSTNYSGSINSYDNDKQRLSFRGQHTANEQVKNYIDNYLRTFVCLGHIIKTYFNPHDHTYYYIDVSTDKLYSTNSEAICEMVSDWEERKEKERVLYKQKKKAAKKVTIHKYVED